MRVLGKTTFLVLKDCSGEVQCVAAPESIKEHHLKLEDTVEIVGRVRQEARAKSGYELDILQVRVLNRSGQQLPFNSFSNLDSVGPETIIEYRPLALRNEVVGNIFRIQAGLLGFFREFLTQRRFTEIITSKLVASGTEGGTNLFEVKYFERVAYLAQSPQFYKQTMVGVFERVYEVGPVFRAEPHDTGRHLAEYVSLDAEIGFIRDHHDVMVILGHVIGAMVEALHERAAPALDLMRLALPVVPARIPEIDFRVAQDMIEAETRRATIGEPDLAPADERWLGNWAAREYGSEFLFVTGYPMAKRPFYTHPSPDDPTVSNSFDLLYRGVELATGGQRLHLYQDYITALEGSDLAPFEGYLEAFRYGMPPHGGFAIGLERWVARLTGSANVRQVTLFPRDLHRLTP
jgi:nondiscriminating aspartyl-tRNA synthetase